MRMNQPCLSANARRRLGKAVMILSIAAMLAGLFSCGREKEPQHSISEVTSVSISCGHMDHSYGYFFWLRKEGEQWLFDTECAIREHSEPITLERLPVDSGTVDEVLAILYAETYKPPRKPIFEALDDTTYSFCLMFSDGSQYSTSELGTAGSALQTFFYALSEQEADHSTFEEGSR